MGYALFANRKIYYTNLVFTLQQQLDNISQQRQDLITFSGNICDGEVTIEEIASDAGNLNNYQAFLEGREAYASTADSEGGAATTAGALGDMAQEQNKGDEFVQSILQAVGGSISEKYAKQVSKKLEALENQLDMKQKNIETKLEAAQKQLEAIQQAEGKAIEGATPKYAGLQ